MIIDDISSGRCKIQIPVQRVSSVLNVDLLLFLLPANFVPYTPVHLSFSFYYIVTPGKNDDLITSFDVALQTVRKIKARVIAFGIHYFQIGEISNRTT